MAEVSLAKPWARAAGKRAQAIRELERLIPFYEYSSSDTAMATNDKFCKLILEKLRVSKDILFNIINTCYEMHIGGEFKEFESIRDELDIFLDEIKVLHMRWNRGMSEKWLEKIISHDLNIIKNSDQLAKNLEILFKKIMRAEKRDSAFWNGMSKDTTVVEEQLDGIVRMFKEREALLNLRPLSFEKTYRAARKEISEKI